MPVFYEAAQLLARNGVRCLLGGGLMVGFYGRSRDTKDIDFFIRPEDKNRAMDVLNAAGFFTQETEKRWLVKAEKAGAPLDLIVHSGGMPDLDDECMARAHVVTLCGYPFPGFGPEDLLLRKIYAWRDGRPDWWDAVSMVQCVGPTMDWDYFARRVPDYNPGRALSFLLFAYSHLAAGHIPWSVIERLGHPFLRDGQMLPAGADGEAATE